jgi:putative endonuclease
MENKNLTRKRLGQLGEGYAYEHLQALRYRILSQNWRCRTGEIDLVAMDGQLLVFVEVRSRSGSAAFGTPQESVNALKQMKVQQAALVYAHRFRLMHLQMRFDVISIRTDREGKLLALEHFPNAF